MSEKFFDGGLASNQPIAIGIDQSLTGFALSAVSMSEPSTHLTWVYKSPKTGIARLKDIQDWLWEKLDLLILHKHLTIVSVAMEGTVVASHAATALGELSGAVRLTLFDYFMVPPMTLKKYTTGKGNSKKQEMLLQVYKKWGIEFNDDNAADSYSLGRLSSGRADNLVEQGIVDQMKDPKYRDKPY
jgi:Holliday junction resolvasome RuvABC endonuclease subunit